MKKIIYSLTFISVSVLALGSCQKKNENQKTEEMSVVENTITAVSVDLPLEAKSGSTLNGNVNFTEADGTVTMTVKVSGVTPGEHAIHIHENPDCSAEDGTSAGGHWNPTQTTHGKWETGQAHHAGDIGNLTVDADGNGSLVFSTDQWCIDCDDAMKNLIGHSVIIHAAVDDFKTQPTGNAGGRIGCAVIK